jgi:hypothetical protein
MMVLAVLHALVTGPGAFAERALWSPGLPESQVDGEGAIHEDWGAVALRIVQPGGAAVTSQRYEESPVPTATTTKSAGTITLTEAAYRAPVWPSGVDVLDAVVANEGNEAQRVVLELALPESVSLGARVGVANGRPVLALPKGLEPIRKERPWGCEGGVVSMPGWARPNRECDPAFRNISAGMGGVPIVYRFAVPEGARRTVVLGFCESHWSLPGQRPLLVAVEGCGGKEIDPLAAWGQHAPGCLRLDGADANRDGRIEVAVNPHPRAPDKNPILNVIWVLEPETSVDTEDLLSGKMTGSAEYYVDVGGERDQTLYEGGPITYDLTLAPGARQELTFLLGTAGGGGVPDPEKTAWNPDSLRRAAEDVWRGYDPARWR